MKRKNKRAEGLKNRINDHWLTATMATGMAGLATAAYVVSKSDDQPTSAAAPDDGPSLLDVGPLLQTVPDFVLPQPAKPPVADLPDPPVPPAEHLPEAPPPAPAVSPENQGTPGLFGDEAADFADTGFQYHQDPDIV